MKNKKVTGLLIVVVAAVWGIIFYRIFAAGKDDSIPFQTPVMKSVKTESLDDYRLKDTFTLKVDYRDPMLDKPFIKELVQEVEPTPVVINKPMNPIAPKPVVPQDAIAYKGYIQNTGKRAAAIVSINNKEVMLEEGQSQDGLTIVKNYRDSLKILYKDHIRIIRLN